MVSRVLSYADLDGGDDISSFGDDSGTYAAGVVVSTPHEWRPDDLYNHSSTQEYSSTEDHDKNNTFPEFSQNKCLPTFVVLAPWWIKALILMSGVVCMFAVVFAVSAALLTRFGMPSRSGSINVSVESVMEIEPSQNATKNNNMSLSRLFASLPPSFAPMTTPYEYEGINDLWAIENNAPSSAQSETPSSPVAKRVSAELHPPESMRLPAPSFFFNNQSSVPSSFVSVAPLPSTHNPKSRLSSVVPTFLKRFSVVAAPSESPTFWETETPTSSLTITPTMSPSPPTMSPVNPSSAPHTREWSSIPSMDDSARPTNDAKSDPPSSYFSVVPTATPSSSASHQPSSFLSVGPSETPVKRTSTVYMASGPFNANTSNHLWEEKTSDDLFVHLGSFLSTPSQSEPQPQAQLSVSTQQVDCEESEYADFRHRLNDHGPVLVTMGYQEWLGCTDPAGSYGYWVDHLAHVEDFWQRQPLDVPVPYSRHDRHPYPDRDDNHQGGSGSDWGVVRDARELPNFSYVRGDVLYVGLRMIRAKRDSFPKFEDYRSHMLEWRDSMERNRQWTVDRISTHGRDVKLLILFGYQPYLVDVKAQAFWTDVSTMARIFSLPTLFVHSSSHAKGPVLENVNDVLGLSRDADVAGVNISTLSVPSSKHHSWVRLTIDPDRNDPFRLEGQL